ncbi:MAG: hypothetical protein RL377_823, partial [Bacteroidota bacterium]
MTNLTLMKNLSVYLLNFLKWFFICIICGLLIGSAAALFLYSLDEVTTWRENNTWAIYTLPVIGLIVGAMYFYFGGEAKKGNNLILEQHQDPQTKIPFKMAPLVLIGTLLTHLGGGSAGREGTAVQMGGAIADQFTNL